MATGRRRRLAVVAYGVALLLGALLVGLGTEAKPPRGLSAPLGQSSRSGHWTFDRVVLHAAWGSKPGEVGKLVYDADASPGDVYLTTAGPRCITVGSDGSLCVADTHNYRVQVFDQGGELRRVIGGKGLGRGRFAGSVEKAVVGPRGRVYAGQIGNRIKKETFPVAAADVWRTGVMSFAPQGTLLFSTRDRLGSPLRDAASSLRDAGDGFWIDTRGRIYEWWMLAEMMVRYTPKGGFDRCLRPPFRLADVARLHLGRDGVFYSASRGPTKRLPDGTWSQPIHIERWRPEEDARAPLVVQQTGRTSEWWVTLVGICPNGIAVVMHVDHQPEAGGLVRIDKSVSTLLAVDPKGEVVAEQDWRRLRASIPTRAAEVPHSHGGLFVGPSLELYWPLVFDKEFQVARFAWQWQ